MVTNITHQHWISPTKYNWAFTKRLLAIYRRLQNIHYGWTYGVKKRIYNNRCHMYQICVARWILVDIEHETCKADAYTNSDNEICLYNWRARSLRLVFEIMRIIWYIQLKVYKAWWFANFEIQSWINDCRWKAVHIWRTK